MCAAFWMQWTLCPLWAGNDAYGLCRDGTRGSRRIGQFLTLLIKVFCTEAGMRSELGVQVLGGYGFLREYRIEQTYRDARITAIYEGANGIHKRMLATRMAQGPSSDAFEQMLTTRGLRRMTWRNGRAYAPKPRTILIPPKWRIALCRPQSMPCRRLCINACQIVLRPIPTPTAFAVFGVRSRTWRGM